LGTNCSRSEEAKSSEEAKRPAVTPVPSRSPASKWEGSLVKRPGGPSVEDGKVYLVRDGKRCWVISADWLKSRGFRFPEDVKVISSEELDAIPLGDVIR
jgi:hypothetical protein